MSDIAPKRRTPVNSLDYYEVAETARKKPFVWVTMRTRQATASVATRIRKGKVAAFPVDEFEVRTRTILPGVYDIEVRYVEESTSSKRYTVSEVMDALESLHPHIRASQLTNAVQRVLRESATSPSADPK